MIFFLLIPTKALSSLLAEASESPLLLSDRPFFFPTCAMCAGPSEKHLGEEAAFSPLADFPEETLEANVNPIIEAHSFFFWRMPFSAFLFLSPRDPPKRTASFPKVPKLPDKPPFPSFLAVRQPSFFLHFWPPFGTYRTVRCSS